LAPAFGLSESDAAAVLYRYANAIDTKDWANLRSCFTLTCVFSAESAGQRLVGADEIVAFMENAHKDIDGSIHRLSNIRIELSEDARSAVSSAALDAFLVHRAHRDGPTFQCIGTYHDRLELHDGTWKIATRDFDTLWTVGNGVILGPTVR
jgi:3-phenylpropionate/cinnamic acid dioxygenase small subunit